MQTALTSTHFVENFNYFIILSSISVNNLNHHKTNVIFSSPSFLNCYKPSPRVRCRKRKLFTETMLQHFNSWIGYVGLQKHNFTRQYPMSFTLNDMSKCFQSVVIDICNNSVYIVKNFN